MRSSDRVLPPFFGGPSLMSQLCHVWTLPNGRGKTPRVPTADRPRPSPRCTNPPKPTTRILRVPPSRQGPECRARLAPSLADSPLAATVDVWVGHIQPEGPPSTANEPLWQDYSGTPPRDVSPPPPVNPLTRRFVREEGHLSQAIDQRRGLLYSLTYRPFAVITYAPCDPRYPGVLLYEGAHPL